MGAILDAPRGMRYGVAMMLSLTVSCGGGNADGGPTAPDTSIPRSITIDPVALSFDAVGDTLRITATVKDQWGRTMPDPPVEWSSPGPAMVTVDGSGLVTARRNGSATVTARAGRASASASATVRQVVEAVDVSAFRAELIPTERVPSIVRQVDANGYATPYPVTYGVQAEGILQVTDSGEVLALRIGTSELTVSVEGISASMTFSVSPPVYVDLDVQARGGCAIATTGAMVCWGSDGSGQLGGLPDSCGEEQGPHRCSGVPVAVPSPEDGPVSWRQIAVQTEAFSIGDAGVACAITDENRLFCWGHGGMGRLGVGAGHGPNSDRPLPVSTAESFVMVDTGGWAGPSCALSVGGHIYCWGPARVWSTDPDDFSDRPTLLPDPPEGGVWSTMSVGGSLVCAIDTQGRTHCWGYNGTGGVGDPSIELQTSVLAPTRINPDPGLVHLDVTRGNACGLDREGALWCWGEVFAGSLEDGEETCLTPGLGRTVACAPQPSRVLDPLSGPVRYAAATAFTDIAACALDESGRSLCWGRHPTAGSPSDLVRPTEVAGDLRFRKIETYWRTTCGLSLEGDVYCWGRGHYGSLGDGVLESAPRWWPEQILGPGAIQTPS